MQILFATSPVLAQKNSIDELPVFLNTVAGQNRTAAEWLECRSKVKVFDRFMLALWLWNNFVFACFPEQFFRHLGLPKERIFVTD